MARGSETAFNLIYAHFSATLYNAVMLYVKDEQEADELLQVIFVQVWEKRDRMADVQSLENYLFILARNVVLNELKKKAREGKLQVQYRNRQSQQAAGTESIIAEKEYRELYRKAVGKLPAQQQQAYRLATDEGLSYEEIAQRMDLSRLTVKKHLELARRQVRDFMNQHLLSFVLLPLLYLSADIFSKA